MEKHPLEAHNKIFNHLFPNEAKTYRLTSLNDYYKVYSSIINKLYTDTKDVENNNIGGVSELERGYYPIFKKFFKGKVDNGNIFFINKPRMTYLDEIDHVIPHDKNALHSNSINRKKSLYLNKLMNEISYNDVHDKLMTLTLRSNTVKNTPIIHSVLSEVFFGGLAFENKEHQAIMKLSFDMFPIQNGIRSCSHLYSKGFENIIHGFNNNMNTLFDKFNDMKLDNFNTIEDKRDYVLGFYCLTEMRHAVHKHFHNKMFEYEMQKIRDKKLIPIFMNVHKTNFIELFSNITPLKKEIKKYI